MRVPGTRYTGTRYTGTRYTTGGQPQIRAVSVGTALNSRRVACYLRPLTKGRANAAGGLTRCAKIAIPRMVTRNGND